MRVPPKSHRNVVIRFVRTATDHQLLAQLDDLVERAAQGDLRAVGAIAIAFGPVLLEQARTELGLLYRNDAADVLQDFFLALSDARLSFPPIRGAALPWMKRMVRAAARAHLQRRSRGGGDLAA